MGLESDPLQNSVRDWIHRTGYPLELRVGQLLQQEGWSPRHAQFYIDHDEGKGREIDLLGWKFLTYGPEETSERADINLGYNFVIECKKSEKPWVIFTRPWVGPAGGPLRNYTFRPDRMEYEYLHVQEALRRMYSPIPYSEAARMGVAFAEALGSQENRPFGAMLAALKAARYLRAQEAEEASLFLTHYLPVVVFEGPLFEATLTAAGVEPQRTNGVYCRLNYESPQYQGVEVGLGVPVYVCTENGFQQFLRQSESSIATFWATASREEIDWVSANAKPWSPPRRSS